ncbi:MAG: TIGR03560 family F420-dependent LLM class oxidoreductase [Chloroflexota bacterium]|nr:TIGR03560 family F420-dependent LLM class oxidoreductase [Chloroflexota bacterium]
MRLCLSIEIQEGMTYADTLAMTRAGEALGYEAALLAEHYYPSGRLENYGASGFGERVAADAWIYLAGLARETSRIRLGTLVSPVTFRHPSVLAKMAATLDHLSDGRAELGIGAGWHEHEHAAYGFDFPPAGRRVDLVEEQLQVITGLWSQDPFSHTGNAYQLRDAHFTPKPVQQPRPTILVGGSSRAERLPRLAARYADEYVTNMPSIEQVRATRERLDRACESNGRDPGTLRLSAFLAMCVAPTEPEVLQQLDTYRATNPQYVRMLDNRDNWIFGTPAQAQAQLDALAAAGVDRALLSVNCEEHLQMLPLLAAQTRS